MADLAVGCVGTIITLESNVDLSAADSVEIRYKKPNGTTGTWTGVADGNNITYTTLSGSIDVAGTWLFQGYATLTSWKGPSSVITTKVTESIIG